jgi:hypothetical protein
MTGAKVVSCTGCSGKKKVGDVGRNTGTLRFNAVTASAAGAATVTISYVNGGDSTRTALFTVDGGAPVTLKFRATRDWNTTGTITVNVTLAAGQNTFTFANPDGPAPDFDKIAVDGAGAKPMGVTVV